MRARQGLLVKVLLFGSVLSLALVWLFHSGYLTGRRYLPGENLIKSLAGAGKVGDTEVNSMLSQLGPALAAELRRGKQIDVAGLGSFQLIDRPEYQAVDGTSGRTVLVPGGKSIVFLPDQTFVNEVNRTDPLPAATPTPSPTPPPVQPHYAESTPASTSSWARP